MEKDFREAYVQNNGKCCVTGELITEPHEVVLVTTHYKCTWPYPRAGNVETNQDGFACAVVSSKAISSITKQLTAPLQWCVEMRGESKKMQFIYHPINTLVVHPFFQTPKMKIVRG